MATLTHVLFDFFGTLVTYSVRRVDRNLPRTHEILVSAGSCLDYSEFLRQWDAVRQEFETRAETSLEEYSMKHICEDFLQRVLPSADADVLVRFRNTYLDEWNQGVSYIPGVTSLLAELSRRFVLVLVTNTNEVDLVRNHLRAMEVTPYFSAVITSVEHGKRKPSHSIFDQALKSSAGVRETSIHVGDSYSSDYLGARGFGVPCLLIDPNRLHEVPDNHRLAHVLETRKLLVDPTANYS
jgi:putative hydrolase of the HAD superfamily